MQHKQPLDRQIRRLLSKHPAPSSYLKEDLWQGVEEALNEEMPVRRPRRWVAISLAAAVVMGGIATMVIRNTGARQTEASYHQRHYVETIRPDKVSDILVEGSNHHSIVNGFHSIKTLPAENTLAEASSGDNDLPVVFHEQNTISSSFQELINLHSVRTVESASAASSNAAPLLSHKKEHRTERDPSSWNSLFMAIWENPAYTGASGKLALGFEDNMSVADYWKNGLYRDVFYADAQIPRTPVSVGVYHDRALNSYSLKTTTAMTVSARVLKIGGGYLSLGGTLGALKKSFYRNNFHYANEYDATYGLAEVTKVRNYTSHSSAMGVGAGAWYGGRNLMAGVSLENANQPVFGYNEQGERVLRTWVVSAGYRIKAGSFQLMPSVDVRRTAAESQAGASLFATYKDRITVGGSLQNINTESLHPDKMMYAGVKAFNRVTIFGEYGRSGEMASLGVNRHIIRTGLRVQFPQ